MENSATALLGRLLEYGEKCNANLRTRHPHLTTSDLASYRDTNDLDHKQRFEAVFNHLQSMGAIDVDWDEYGFICRIKLRDINQLSKHLGTVLKSDSLQQVRNLLDEHLSSFPMLIEVLDRWAQHKKARGL